MTAPSPSLHVPEDCDLGIITVIGVELQQVLKAFEIPQKRGRQRGTCYYWETTVYSQELQRPLKIVIGCIAEAGMVHAAIRTASFLQVYRPSMMLLVGIAAGWRHKQRIGQVVWPRHVTAISAVEVRAEGYLFRPTTHKPLPAVLQMLQWWKVKESELAAHTERIMAGEVVGGRDAKDEYGLHVMYPPNAEECVIGCGDFLLRHDDHFTKLRINDPQVTICEMECAGMVLALRDTSPLTAWLQVRGVSDFGDSNKHRGWHPYAAAAASAFARLFAEQCFDPSVILGVKPVDPAPAAATREQPAESRSMATSIPVEVADTASASASALGGFETIRSMWKKSRDLKTGEKLQSLRESPEFKAATPETQAKILRFEAKVLLETRHDGDGAAELAKLADELTGPQRAMAALLAVNRKGPAAAAEMLNSPTTLEEWNQRMGFFLQANDADRVLKEWDTPPEGVGPDVESHRLRTYALLMKKHVSEARTVFAKIGAPHQETFAIRLTRGVLDFYEAVSPAAFDRAFQLQPIPIPPGFIKRDEASLAALDRAEAVFSELTKEMPKGSEVYFELQAWRLAATALNARRRSEAEELCRQLLEERPTDVQFLGWADACEFNIERGGNLTALAAELGVKL